MIVVDMYHPISPYWGIIITLQRNRNLVTYGKEVIMIITQDSVKKGGYPC